MSIEKRYGEFILVCDVCTEALDMQFDTFSEALDWAKDYGWKTIRVDDDWENICPVCNEVG